MPINPGITVRIGTGPGNATGVNPAIGDTRPYVEWTLPAGYQQVRYSVLFRNDEPGGFAYHTSGERSTSQQFYRWPENVAMGAAFEGKCYVQVAVSQYVEGEFEDLSPPLYFCYDRQLEMLLTVPAVTLSWQAAQDPDLLPGGSGRKFHLQIARDVLFNGVAYDNPNVFNTTDPVVEFGVPAAQFVPQVNTNYFYRVRQFDGLDWGPWSIVNAFGNFNNVKPAVTIESVTPLGNEFGDHLITFTVADVNNDRVAVAIYYQGGNSPTEAVPVSTLEPRLHLPPGTHTATWRTIRQLSNQLYTDIRLIASASDRMGTGGSSDEFPCTIDNSKIVIPGGGGANNTWHVRVRGWSGEPTKWHDQRDHYTAVVGRLVKDRRLYHDASPVSARPYAWREAFAICPLERRRSQMMSSEPKVSTEDWGWGRTGSLEWPDILIRSTSVHVADAQVDALRIAPHTSDQKFTFPHPAAYNDQGYATPISSKAMPRTPYLRGWIDANGVEREYPDGYDFGRRPAWHEGREVWGVGDGWVQTQVMKITQWENCGVCGGRGWLVTAGPPYRRGPCTNPTCVGGFDEARPLAHWQTGHRFCKAYVDVMWMRLGRWANGGRFDEDNLYGLRTKQGEFAHAIQHVVGGGLSSLNVVTKTVTDSQGRKQRVVDYYHVPETGRALPADTAVVHPASNTAIGAITRQPDDGSAVRGSLTTARREWWKHLVGRAMPAGGGHDGTTRQPDDGTATGGRITGSQELHEVGGVQGRVGKIGERFFMGMTPDSHPGHARRPTPTQEGGLRVAGRTWYRMTTVPMGFAFLQPYWDSYNTIHWRHTVATTTMYQLQAAPVQTNGTVNETDFCDVRGDNAVWNDSLRTWLVSPLVTHPEWDPAGRKFKPVIDRLTFHMYWDTADRAEFPDGSGWQLRVRAIDFSNPNSPTFGEWVASSPFEIIEGVTNPASVLATEYEPWTKTVTITFRLDDTAGRTYSVTGLSWSDDDGATWHPVGTGDLGGDIHNLTTTPGRNVHAIRWNSSAAALRAGNKYRVAIDVAPTDAVADVMVPSFKWYTPVNPAIDEAESELTDILGRVESRVYDPDAGHWVALNPPRRIGGILSNLAAQAENVRSHPTESSPNGVYDHLSPAVGGNLLAKPWPTDPTKNTWKVIDPTGYEQWLREKFTNTETHGQALTRIGREAAYHADSRLPDIRRTITAGEVAIRKRLMDQGFFAEQFFDQSDGGEVVETITVPARDMVVDSGVRMVARWWRFRVQSIAEGPTGVYDAQGDYAPQDVTELERVRYRWQMDRAATFDSQTHRKPLRERYTDYDGTPLAVAEFTVPPSGTTGQVQPGDRAVNVGGTLKLPPAELPGKRAGDQLAAGQTSFEDAYRWRVAAYNPITAPVTARPRPLITALTPEPVNDRVRVDYLAQAHEAITEMSPDHYYGNYGFSFYSYEVSTAYKAAPEWARRPVMWLSDRRAPRTPDNASRRINSIDWVWPGTSRQRATILYDEGLMQYVGFVAKPDPNDPAGKRARVVGFRAMEADQPCEYDVYFADESPLRVADPFLTKSAGRFRLYVTTQELDGGSPAVSVADSADADHWGYLTAAVEDAACASVVFAGGKHVLFFERRVGGVPQVFTTESGDGLTFGPATQVTSEASGARAPSAILWGGKWRLFYRAGNQIVSLAGDSPAALGGRQVEVNAFQDDNSVAWTPASATAFIDRYRCNEELHLLLDATDAQGDHSTWLLRLEDRQWVAGDSGGVWGEAGHVTSVPTTREGVGRTLYVGMSANAVASGADVKVRMWFPNFLPQQTTYRRQSDWVEAPGGNGSVLDPPAFAYSKLLDSYPYLK